MRHAGVGYNPLVQEEISPAFRAGRVDVVATPDRLVVRRRLFTDGVTVFRFVAWALLAASLGALAMTPIALVFGVVAASVSGMVAILLAGAERAARPRLRVLHRALVLTRTTAEGGYRDAAPERASTLTLTLDGRAVPGPAREIAIRRRHEARGNVVGYAVYVVAPATVVEVTVTKEVAEARNLARTLERFLGFEQPGDKPVDEPWAAGAIGWGVLICLVYIGGATALGLVHLVSDRGADHVHYAVAVVAAIAIAEPLFGVVYGRLARASMQRFLGLTFGPP